MIPSKPVPRILQQPAPDEDQQQRGSNQADAEQPAPEGQQQMGEGSYEATHDYQRNIKDYLKKADIEADAQAAKPRSEDEARELDQAEQQGRSHSKGER